MNRYQVAAAVTIAALLLALGPWPYAYYMLLRLLVTGAGVYLGVVVAQLLPGRRWLAALLLIAAVLFNPFMPVHLTRDIWAVLNVAGAGLFAWAWWALRSAAVRIRPGPPSLPGPGPRGP